ncbi:hypothetical protein HYH02_008841 [Chlamydomonas schloesseri]|uniref:Uncharacterized protein n=1 Tax=Chlamydomonas schloesseri TaxID=2026947 RepID=A0A835WDG0_9CHLO|nr:hypothetical protein HYH02_008841 [Chlamydomonas schloesseri]|eukprot:KAG2445376.1 hypothetical protein HYH02_008841 [Chlamydomonas schloesseri]
MRLAVLLPVTSRGCQGAGDVRALFARLQRLRRHLDPPAHPAPPDQTQPPSPAAAATAAAQQPQPGDRAGSSSSSGSSWITAAHVCVCLGVDEDDPWLMASELPPAAAAAVAADAPAGPMPEVEGEVQDGSSPAGADGPNGAAARGSSFLVQAFPGLPVRLVVFTRAELELHQVDVVRGGWVDAERVEGERGSRL